MSRFPAQLITRPKKRNLLSWYAGGVVAVLCLIIGLVFVFSTSHKVRGIAKTDTTARPETKSESRAQSESTEGSEPKPDETPDAKSEPTSHLKHKAIEPTPPSGKIMQEDYSATNMQNSNRMDVKYDHKKSPLSYLDFYDSYKKRLITEDKYRSQDARAPFGAPRMGRVLEITGTDTDLRTGEVLQKNRHYHYGNDGTITVTDKSTTSHSDPGATTYKYDLTEMMDVLGRTMYVKGKIVDSTGRTFNVSRTHGYDSKLGVITITDKLTTTEQDSKTHFCQCDLREKMDTLGRKLALVGTITYATGETLTLNRTYEYDSGMGVLIVTDKSSTTHTSATATTYRYDLREKYDALERKLSLEGTVTDSNGRVLRVKRKWESGNDGAVKVVDE